MQFGHFDDEAYEYVVDRPDTPTSWSNYLGTTQYGAIITNNAGGYGFYRSGAQGRFMRLRFNSIPMDQPGRYFYLRDNDSKDYWSASWQPVGKPLDQFKNVCRHGTAYTIISSDYSDIHTDATYFVPLGQTFEYWRLDVENKSDKPRNLSAFTYCEFASQWNTTQDLVNLQYSLFIMEADKKADNILGYSIHDNIYKQHPEYELGGLVQQEWFAVCEAPMTHYDTSREKFLGTYGSYKEPKAVIEGQCSDSWCYGDTACGSIQSDMVLQPGEKKTVLILLGIGNANAVGEKIVAEYGSVKRFDEEFEKLKADWHSKLTSFKAKTPDEDINHTANVWGLYNNLITFSWSRAASLVYNGERDGLGYRDSVQDTLGVNAAIPELSKARLKQMLSGQTFCGGAMPLIKLGHNPGHEKCPEEREFRSDDCQWFFNAIPAYVAETGDLDFFNEVVPYADHGEDTVYDHLKKALLFNIERSGADGLPSGLAADWNDCLQTGYHGESVMVTFQLRLGLTTYADISKLLGKEDEAAWALKQRDILDEAIQKKAWDGKWWIWAVGEDGTVYGTDKYDEGKVYLNTQVWAVMSGACKGDQEKLCLDAVDDQLFSEYGLKLCAPAIVYTPQTVMGCVVFPTGIKENGGIFNHTQGWGVMAETVAGNGNRAYKYLKAALPASYNTRAEIRQSEPYVQGQTTYSDESPRPGNCRTSWLSGAVAWTYYSLTQYVLGIRPQYNGMLIDPCIPDSWDGFEVERSFRGKKLHIEVKNPEHVCKGISYIVVNGEKLESAVIPVDKLADGENKIEAVMGKNAQSVPFERL